MKKRLELEGVVLAAIMMISVFVAITPIVSANGVEYWAVIAGVSDYADPSIPDLSYSGDDANDIYDSLLNYDNWEANNIMLLIDSDATKANIHGAIDWMKTNADDNDICLFFFSGHGGWSDDVPPFDEYDGCDEYICPYDSTHWFEDSIRDDELDAWMTPIEAKKIVILDTCFAGGAYRVTDASIKTKPNVPYPKLAKDFAKDLAKDLNKAGYVVLAACDDFDLSWESDILENGVFTYYVVEGLNGPANADADNDISTEEIYEYADPLVIDYTGGLQDPVLYDNVPGELPVVELPSLAPPPTTTGITTTECPTRVNCPTGPLCPWLESCLTGVACPTGAGCPTGATCVTGTTCITGPGCTTGAGCITGVGCPGGAGCITTDDFPTGAACPTGAGCITGAGCTTGDTCLTGATCPTGAGCNNCEGPTSATTPTSLNCPTGPLCPWLESCPAAW